MEAILPQKIYKMIVIVEQKSIPPDSGGLDKATI